MVHPHGCPWRLAAGGCGGPRWPTIRSSVAVALDPAVAPALAMDCLGDGQHDRDDTPVRGGGSPRRMAFHPGLDMPLLEFGDGQGATVPAQVVEPAYGVVSMPLADRAIGHAPLAVLEVVRADPRHQPPLAAQRACRIRYVGHFHARQGRFG